jgi:signal transduction histidine kinase
MVINIIICILLLIGIFVAYLNLKTTRARCTEEEINYRNKLWTILICNKELQVKNIFHPTPDSLFVDDAIVLLHNNLQQLVYFANKKNKKQAEKIILKAESVVRKKKSLFFTFKNHTSDGNLKYFLCFIDYVNEDQVYIEIREDITHREKLQEERKKALIELQTIYKALPLGISLYNKEGKLIDCNTKLLELFHIQEKNELLSQDFTLKNDPFVSTLTQKSTFSNGIIAGQNKFIFSKEKFNFIAPNKKGFLNLNIKIVPIGDDNVALGYIGIIENITEILNTNKQLENALAQVKQSDQLKSTFLANMSHEIRTPLNAIIGFSQLIMDTQDREALREYMAIIEENNELLLKLINDILTLSRIEAGINENSKTVFDICQLCKDIAQAMQPFVNDKVTIKTRLPQEELSVYFDINHLNKVLHNMMTNAVKFTLQGHIYIGFEIQDKTLYLFVEDTGIGIAKENISRVFERFEKLNSFAKGTGLGMAIAKALVHSTGGQIGAESQQNKGSKFWISYSLDQISADKVQNQPAINKEKHRDLFY